MPLAKLVPGIPEGLSEIVEKMMRKSPDDRYPTPLDVAQALEPYTDTPAGTTYAGPGSSAVRGGGRSALTETQVVDAPRMVTGPAPPVTQVAIAPGRRRRRPSPISAKSSSHGDQALTGGEATGSTSRSNENWGDLGLGIDLGPEPSLTEGLQSGKKKSRLSSSGISEVPEAARAPARAGGNGPDAGEPGGPRRARGRRRTAWCVDLGPEPPLSTHTQAGQGQGRGAARRGRDSRSAAEAPLVDRRGSARVRCRRGGHPLRIRPDRPGRVERQRHNEIVCLARDRREGVDARAGRPVEVGPGPAKTKTSDAAEVPADEPIAVKTPDGVVKIEPNLKSAMQRAIGSKGHVLLNNRTPLKLSGPDAALTIGGGRLYIRAAEGVQPVVEVEMQGQKPFLSTRTDTPLTIVGVTFVARYRGKPKMVPALIQAGADLTLDRCAFTASGGVEGSRAVVAEGGSLTVSGCWFEGFATALDVASFAGSITKIKQSMMVRARTDAQPIGWALRIRRAPGGNTKERRRLVLEHCTAKGAGLLDLVDFSPQSPLQVGIKQCAVMAEALLAWQTSKPATPLTAEALDWKGEGNQYDIRGKSWVVLSAEGMTELPDGPIDLASWRSKVTEQDPIPPPVRFRVDPESLSESPQPGDFAIIDPEVHPPGADPDHVGPTAPPERALIVRVSSFSRPPVVAEQVLARLEDAVAAVLGGRRGLRGLGLEVGEVGLAEGALDDIEVEA